MGKFFYVIGLNAKCYVACALLCVTRVTPNWFTQQQCIELAYAKLLVQYNFLVYNYSFSRLFDSWSVGTEADWIMRRISPSVFQENKGAGFDKYNVEVHSRPSKCSWCSYVIDRKQGVEIGIVKDLRAAMMVYAMDVFLGLCCVILFITICYISK